jgi:ABC-2 type transport system permease protein
MTNALRLGLARGVVELKTFFRQKEAVVFTFSLPAVIMVLLAGIFSNLDPNSGVTMSQFFVASMTAGGIASTSFVNLGIGVATDRQNGTLKRLRGVPMPAASYFIGKIVLVLVASMAEAALLLGVGVAFFDLALPTTAAKWLTFAWVFLLGIGACSLLGIAISGLARTAQGAIAMTNLGLLILNFISGIYIMHLALLPKGMVVAGSLFPLKWMGQGFRSVFLPDTVLYQEMAGSWEHGRTALVLAAWCIGGLALCVMTFRLRGRAES